MKLPAKVARCNANGGLAQEAKRRKRDCIARSLDLGSAVLCPSCLVASRSGALRQLHFLTFLQNVSAHPGLRSD